MNAEERRVKARKIRIMTRGGMHEGKTMDEIAMAQGVARGYAYQLVKELEDWEGTGNFEAQAREVNEHHMQRYHVQKWFLCSGYMINAYVRGEISRTLLNGAADGKQNDICMDEERDPLMD